MEPFFGKNAIQKDSMACGSMNVAKYYRAPTDFAVKSDCCMLQGHELFFFIQFA